MLVCFQALKTDSYDHYTAIYYLLLERLRAHRSSFPVENHTDYRKRRPSTIAEQAMFRVDLNQPTPVMGGLKQFGQSTDSGMGQGRDSVCSESEGMGGGGSVCLQDIIPQQPANPVAPLAGNMITTSIDEGVEADIMEDRDVDDIVTHKGQTFVKDGFGLGLIPSSAFGDFSQLSNTSLASLGTSSCGSPFTSFDSSLEADLVSSLSGFNSVFPGISVNTLESCTPTTTTMAQAMGCNSLQGQATADEQLQDRSQNTSPVDFREGRRASDGLVAQGIIAFRQRLKESMKCPGMTELRPDHQHIHNVYGIKMAPSSLLHDHTEETTEQQTMVAGDNPQQRQRPRPLMKRMSLPSETVDMQPHRLLALKQSMQLEQQMDRVSSQDPVQQPIPAFGESSKPLQQQLLQHRLQQKRQSFHQKHAVHPPHPQLHQQFQQLQLDPQQSLYQHSTSSQQSTSCDNNLVDSYPPQNTVNVSLSNALVHNNCNPSLMNRPPPPIIRKSSYKLAQQQPVLPECSDTELLPWQRTIIEQQGHLVQNPLVCPPTGQMIQHISDITRGRRSGCVNFIPHIEFHTQQIQNETITEMADYSNNQCNYDYDCSMDTGENQDFSLDNYVQADDVYSQQQQQQQQDMGMMGQYLYQPVSQQAPFNMAAVNMATAEDSSMDMS